MNNVFVLLLTLLAATAGLNSCNQSLNISCPTCDQLLSSSSSSSSSVVSSSSSSVTSSSSSSVTSSSSSSVSSSSSSSVASADNPCGMLLNDTPTIFCDTFDAPHKTTSRAGDLDANVWGVSRANGLVNFGQQQYGTWAQAGIQKCDGSIALVNPPNDVIICNGQLREATNDNVYNIFEYGTVTVLAMYPKQPFDFTGRTGTVSFDVSNDTGGSHAAWPEFWMSDLPVPVPFNHFDSWRALPQNGFGIRLDAGAPIGQYGFCPNLNNVDKLRWTVGSVSVSRNYVWDDTFGQLFPNTNVKVTPLDCVIEPTGPDQMNHVELRISQNQIDVYATDAGVPPSLAALKHISVITNLNLTLSKGLIWLEDVHYNADKGPTDRPSQRNHTFAWDNVAFDGPFTYRDFSYDALDNNVPGINNSVNIGKLSVANGYSTWNVLNMPANPQAAAVRVLFSFDGEANTVAPTALNVIVNGHAHSVPWPYIDPQPSPRTYAITIPISDLVAGTNVVQLGADQSLVIANVNIVLVHVPGGVPVLPGSNNAYPVQ